ncbi:MAG TPA: Na+/H+ antiporter subunit E [Halomonas sp.]|nr:Na+/H+ antiporter subunit E [Halomonas sp.]
MTRFSRWFPTPRLSLLLLVVWLLLTSSLSLGHLLLGSVLAVSIPLFTYRFWDIQPGIRRPGLLIRFILRVMLDIVTSSVHVAWLIINPWRRMRPVFVEYPLTLKEPFTITLLANTISLTPGTVTTNVRLDNTSLLVHALDASDPDEVIEQIRERYEKPLKEIYEC